MDPNLDHHTYEVGWLIFGYISPICMEVDVQQLSKIGKGCATQVEQGDKNTTACVPISKAAKEPRLKKKIKMHPRNNPTPYMVNAPRKAPAKRRKQSERISTSGMVP